MTAARAHGRANREKSSRRDAVATRDRILDAAEGLFAERGYFGVSVRDITQAAKTRLSGMNYHFTSKEELFLETIQRRASWVNAERQRLLREAIMKNVADSSERLRQIVRAFYGPLLERSVQGGPGWKNYCRLVAQTAQSAHWVQNVIGPTFNPVGQEFVAALKTTFPKVGRQRLHACYQLMLGAMLYIFSESGRLDSMSDGQFSSSDLPTLCEELEEFAVAGLGSLCGVGSRPR